MTKKLILVVFNRFSNHIPPKNNYLLIAHILTSELYTCLDKISTLF